MSQDAIRKNLEKGTFARVLDVGALAKAKASWDEGLARDARLLVPVDVRALVASGRNPVSFVPTVTQVPKDDSSWPEHPPVFAEGRRRPAGVYVHVAMPDGLTRGTRRHAGDAIGVGNPMGLPTLPDRVLVTRLLHGSTKRRIWMLLADQAKQVDLTALAATQTTDESRRLTAVSGGDAAWAATFDAVVDRYALYDDLSDLTEAERTSGRASYLVIAFWSDDAQDPLHGISTLGRFESRLAELGWFAPSLPKSSGKEQRIEHIVQAEAGLVGREPAGAFSVVAENGLQAPLLTLGVDPKWTGAEVAEVLQHEPLFPANALLHGCVFGVSLGGDGPDLAPVADEIQLALGGSGMGALAALLASGTPAERLSQERLLAAFFEQLLDRVDTADGLADVDEARHTSTFTALHGGQRARPDRIADGGAPPADTAATTRTDMFLSEKRAKKRTAKAQKRAPKHTDPRTFRDVSVAMPRYFVPNDPAIVIRGARRSERHGGDRRHAPDERMHCRLPHEIRRSYSGILDANDLPPDLRAFEAGGLPPECDALLAEAVLLDPFRTEELAAWANRARGLPTAALIARFEAEMVLRYVPTKEGTRRESALRDPEADSFRRASLLDGVDPSPVAGHLWAQPWTPLWLDYELDLALEDEEADFTLRGVDLEPQRTPAVTPAPLGGRILVTAASATGLAAQIRRWLDEEDKRHAANQGVLAPGEEAELAVLAAAADGLDVLTGALGGLRRHLLGFEPRGGEVERFDAHGNLVGRPPPKGDPRLFVSGRARIARARVVDAFGRYIDLPPSVLAQVALAATHVSPENDGSIVLRPRLQAPARVLFRFVDPAVGDDAPPVDAHVDQEAASGGASPVAGWLLPDHVDESLEVFDATAAELGQLMHDPLTGAVVWEGAPGRPGPLGHAPDDGGSPAGRHLQRFAVGLIAADAAARASARPPSESALSAFLRAVDTTLWTVDPFHHFGTGSVAGLVGRPIAVVRATLKLEVPSDVAQLTFEDDTSRAARAAAFASLVHRVVRARLGELTRTDDGLLAYSVDDDYRSLRIVAADIRGRARSPFFGGPDVPIDHPYLADTPEIELHPWQLVNLTLLMVPGASVTLTTGVLPRKRITMAREWFAKTLERLSPSFRAGPLLLDAGPVRLPKISGLGKKQRLTYKPNALDWKNDPIAAATQTAYLPELPSIVREGWIRVAPDEEGPSS